MENFYQKTNSMRSIMDEKLNEMDKIFEITKIFSISFDSHSKNLQEMILSLLETDFIKNCEKKKNLNFIKNKNMINSSKTLDENFLLYNQKNFLRKKNSDRKCFLNFEATNYSTVEKFRKKNNKNEKKKKFDLETIKNENLKKSEKIVEPKFFEILKNQNDNMTKLLENGQEGSKVLRDLFNKMFDSLIKFENSKKKKNDFDEISKKKKYYKNEMKKFKKLFLDGKLENEILNQKKNFDYEKKISELENENLKKNFKIENFVKKNENLENENFMLKKNLFEYINQIDKLKNVINDYKFDFHVLQNNINQNFQNENFLNQKKNYENFENFQNEKNFQNYENFQNENFANKNTNTFSFEKIQKKNNFPTTLKKVSKGPNEVSPSNTFIENYKNAISQRNQLIKIIKSLPDSNMENSINTDKTSNLNFCSFNNSLKEFTDSVNTKKGENKKIEVIGLKNSRELSELSSFDEDYVDDNCFKNSENRNFEKNGNFGNFGNFEKNENSSKNIKIEIYNDIEEKDKSIPFLTFNKLMDKKDTENSSKKKNIFENSKKNIFENSKKNIFEKKNSSTSSNSSKKKNFSETLEIFQKKHEKDEESSYSYVNINSEDFSDISNSIQKNNKGRDSVPISIENNKNERKTEKKIFKSERELPLEEPKICKFNVYGNIKAVSKSLQMEDLNELLRQDGDKFAKDTLVENFSSFNKDG